MKKEPIGLYELKFKLTDHKITLDENLLSVMETEKQFRVVEGKCWLTIIDKTKLDFLDISQNINELSITTYSRSENLEETKLKIMVYVRQNILGREKVVFNMAKQFNDFDNENK